MVDIIKKKEVMSRKVVELTLTAFLKEAETDPIAVGRWLVEILREHEDYAEFKVEIPARGILEPHKDAYVLEEIYELREHTKALESINADLRRQLAESKQSIFKFMGWIRSLRETSVKRGPTF